MVGRGRVVGWIWVLLASASLAACGGGDGGGQDACVGAACPSSDATDGRDVVEPAETALQADAAGGTDQATTGADVVEIAPDVASADAAVDAAPDLAEEQVETAPEIVAPVDIHLALSALTASAQFFDYQAPTATVRYFAVLDGAGAPHVAFDACDVCYGAKKGYRQDGDEMVCNNCGNRFPITSLGTENQTGGCWPGYLQAEITAHYVSIAPATLEAGSWYFE
jgi:hypothetical protein